MAEAPQHDDLDERQTGAFVWASAGRGARQAKAERRWNRIRGAVLIATGLAFAQALLLYIVVRVLQDRGGSLRLIVPIAALSTLALLAFLGLVRTGFGRDPEEAPEASILAVVAAARGALRRGFDAQSAAVLAYEAHAQLGYDAVSVTDRGEVLAHAGLGADHHGKGQAVPPGAIGAMAENRVVRLPVGWKHGCDGRDCPLRSAVALPLSVRGASVGSVLLFSQRALQISDRDRSLALQLGALVSNEIELGELDLQTRQTADAELAALQAQLEPHFLFNALNTIAAFCRTKPDEARSLVLAFADHCRFALRRPGSFVPLSDELKHVEAYVALERARFGDQLEVDVRASPLALTTPVPPFLVQPLVENAIKHGKADRPLRVVVRCEVRLGRLRITVRDNGRGIAREVADRVMEPGVGSGAAGIGLSSVAQRLAAFYGETGRLRIASAPRIGTLVSVVVPVEREERS